MVKPKTLLINKDFILLTLGFLYFSTWAQNQAIQDSLPFDAVIQEERQGLLTKFYGNTRFTLNQAYFSNWITGGESSIITLFALDYNLNLSNRRGLVWDNNVLLSLGSTYISGDKFVKKADDRFEINSLVGKQINQHWNLARSPAAGSRTRNSTSRSPKGKITMEGGRKTPSEGGVRCVSEALVCVRLVPHES